MAAQLRSLWATLKIMVPVFIVGVWVISGDENFHDSLGVWFLMAIVCGHVLYKHNRTKQTFSAAASSTFGSAHWSTFNDLKLSGLLNRRGGIYLGLARRRFWQRPRRIGYKGPSHLITVAPPRSGKFRDVIAEAVMGYEGSCILIDPKAQAACVTAAGRRAQGKVIVLNPFDVHHALTGPSASYNPMDNLNPNAKSFSADCDALTDGIVQKTGGHKDSFFDEGAAILIGGVIQQVMRCEPPQHRNLNRVRSIIAGRTSILAAFCTQAATGPDAIIRNKLARLSEITEDTRSLQDIKTTASQQLAFLDDQCIAASVATSTFRFADLRRERTTVYIVLPLERIATNGNWFRLIVSGMLSELLRAEKSGRVPVLAILDEFATLGRMRAIENAMGMAAGLGLQLWPILQSLTQLAESYGEPGWQTFMSCAGVQQFFAPRDNFTAEYVSRRCGDSTITTVNQSTHEISKQQAKGGFKGVNYSRSEAQRPLLYPQEAMAMERDRQLLLTEDLPHPARVSRRPYWRTARRISAQFSRDPYHH